MRQIVVALLVSLPAVSALQCFICGDNNLDEFGECSAQFPYDCGSYAQRFSPDERIYCRTTRHKAPNETYTILKECISETDHFKKFPQKEYPLDEECDLVEIDGQEVAYCICSSKSLCNEKSIADQFMVFEQKHPELFASEESFEELPSPAQSGVPQIQPQPILPVNDPRFATNSRETLPARVDMKDMESEEIDALFKAREAAKSKTNGMTRIDAPLPGPARSSGFVFSTNALDGTMIKGKKTAEDHFLQRAPARENSAVKPVPEPLPSPLLSAEPLSTLRCAQCGQAMLPDENSDCAGQAIIDCAGTDTLCFTRQILLGPGQNAIEKMCVNSVALQNEYGDDAPLQGGCGEAHNGKVRYCVCTTNECNAGAIQQQIAMQQPLIETASETVPEMENSVPDIAAVPDEELPPPAPVLEPIQPVNQPTITEQPPPPRPTFTPNPPAVPVPAPIPTALPALPPPPPPPPPPSPPTTTITQNIRKRPIQVKPSDVTENMITGAPDDGMRCQMCAEAETTTANGDCTNGLTVSCQRAQEFCLTKQTQLATGLYTLEKKCVSADELRMEFPENSVDTGCATAFDGLVSYCVCAEDTCNIRSLQDQFTNFKHLMHVEEPSEEEDISEPGPVPDSIDLQAELEQLKEKERQSVDITGLPTGEELEKRQRDWAQKEAEITKFSASLSLYAAVLLLPVLLL